MPDLPLADECGRGMVLERDAVEDILPTRQAFNQGLGGEVGFRQRVDIDGIADGLEAFRGGDLDQHTGCTIGARPDNAGIDRNVTGLDSVRDRRPVCSATEIGSCNGAGGSHCRR